MARRRSGARTSARRVPHRRGDGPMGMQLNRFVARRSPQAWGWPVRPSPRLRCAAAFPTGVGMARRIAPASWGVCGVPHRRGDGPPPAYTLSTFGKRSPQAWGWPDLSPGAGHSIIAFPTGVGMARVERAPGLPARRVPHRRGDGPYSSFSSTPSPWRSPQAWGWPGRPGARADAGIAFPTGVGMARPAHLRGRGAAGVPHRRGDGPRWRGGEV